MRVVCGVIAKSLRLIDGDGHIPVDILVPDFVVMFEAMSDCPPKREEEPKLDWKTMGF